MQMVTAESLPSIYHWCTMQGKRMLDALELQRESIKQLVGCMQLGLMHQLFGSTVSIGHDVSNTIAVSTEGLCM